MCQVILHPPFGAASNADRSIPESAAPRLRHFSNSQGVRELLFPGLTSEQLRIATIDADTHSFPGKHR
jgi:hypothetical protein